MSLAMVSVVVCLVAVPTGLAVASVAPPLVHWGPGADHLNHIITVMLENRDYDNYFGAYCLQLGKYCSSTGNGIPNGTCVPYDPTNLSLGCVAPYNFTAQDFSTPDMEHDWYSGSIAYDSGRMDGFYNAEYSGTLPFGHFNGSTLPIYWDLAEQYAIGDNFFAGNLSYSLPNHWNLIAGQAPPTSVVSYLGSRTDQHAYLNESDGTRTVQDLLNGSGVSWKYYDFPLESRYRAVHNFNFVDAGSAYDYWNPMAARAESYSSWYDSHFVPRMQILRDIRNGSLPQLSWLIPDWTVSDHAPANVTAGESWIAQLVNTLENSTEWNSTALFVIWDDYGGYYDHVAPPTLHGRLLSMRSPILAIGPYVKENFISHVQLSFFSLLRFAEWQFKLGCLTVMDCTATPPFDFFDFNQTARPPMHFRIDWTKASYPMPLQNNSKVGAPCDGCDRIVLAEWTGGSVYDTNSSHDD